MAVKIDGKMFEVGDEIHTNGKKGIIWKVYKEKDTVSVAIKYDNSTYEMYLAENIVLDK
jgi:preprotein translocase subunit YajC